MGSVRCDTKRGKKVISEVWISSDVLCCPPSHKNYNQSFDFQLLKYYYLIGRLVDELVLTDWLI